MNRKAAAAIRQYHMIQQGARVYVGLSGGADSVALLHFFHTAGQQWDIELWALHLNHNLRGEESRRDEGFVRALCAQWEIPLVVESRDVGALAEQGKGTVEECARRARYAFFERHAVRSPGKSGLVATAHTLTDSVETTVFHLARGTGLRGLCGIPPVRDYLIRPLTGCTREEVEAYCARHRLPFVQDSSNLDERYTRNKLRSRVLPVLREINPALERTMEANSAALREDEAFLQELAGRAAADCLAGGGLDRGRLLELPGPIRRRVWLHFLRERGISYDSRRLRLLDAAAEERGTLQLNSRWFFSAAGASMRFYQEAAEEPYFEIPVSPEERGREGLWEISLPFRKRLQLLRTDYEIFEKKHKDSKKALKNALDYDKISGIVLLRQRKPGDAYHPQGRGCGKTLKKLLNEAKCDVAARSRTLVLAAEDRVLWVEGFGPDEACRVRRGITREVLLLSVVEDCE